MRWTAALAVWLAALPAVAQTPAQYYPGPGTVLGAANFAGTLLPSHGGTGIRNSNSITVAFLGGDPQAFTTARLGINGGNTFWGGSGNEAAGALNVSGTENTYIGDKAGSTATGSFNTAFGHNAFGQGAGLGSGPTGNHNSFFGTDSGRNITGAAADNTAIGFGALAGAATTFSGTNATAVGSLACNNATTASHILCLGYNVASALSLTGSYDIFIGNDQGVAPVSAGTSNAVAIGTSILVGTNDVMIGNGAGAATTSDGNRSVAIGFSAGTRATSATEYIAIGDSALSHITTSGGNVAIGGGAGLAATSSNSSYYGVNAGKSVTSGTGTYIGNGVSSSTCQTGANVLLVGTSSALDCPANNTANYIALGAGGAAALSITGTNVPSTSVVTATGLFAITTLTTWADNQTCTAGQITWDASFIYVCSAANTVKRAALSTF